MTVESLRNKIGSMGIAVRDLTYVALYRGDS